MADLTTIISGGFFDYILDIVSFITSPEDFPPAFYDIYKTVRVFFVFLSIILIAAFFFLTSKSKYFNYSFKEEQTERKKGRPFVDVKLKGNIEEMILQAKEKEETERKLAVIEADDLISDALFQMGHKGQNIIEQTKNLTEEILPNIEELKKAHLKRKEIVESPERKLSEEEALNTVLIYKKTLKELRIIQ
ncbi:MAG: hypothetical protein PF549_03370 [Patescibacteria group bacterium]|jgi:hypothetical protein|nr:hypothetical protein [Patescibacteria group bacterium]